MMSLKANSQKCITFNTQEKKICFSQNTKLHS